MLNIIKHVLLAVVVLFPVYTHSESQMKKIIATGMGVTEEKAIINASKSAVKQAVGMYVVSDMIMENSELIKDEILNYSNGFVKTFKIIDKSVDDGIHEIEIAAEVEVGRLQEKIKGLNIATKKVGSTKLKVKAISKQTRSADFIGVSRKVFLDPLQETGHSLKVEILGLHDIEENSDILKRVLRTSVHKMAESKNMIPMQLDFTVTLDSPYLNNLYKFLDKSSTNKSRSYKDGKNRIFMYNYKDGKLKLMFNFLMKRVEYNSLVKHCKNIPHINTIEIDLLDSKGDLIKSGIYVVDSKKMKVSENSDMTMQPPLAYTNDTSRGIVIRDYYSSNDVYLKNGSRKGAGISKRDLARGVSCSAGFYHGNNTIALLKNTTKVSSVIYLDASDVEMIDSATIKVD